MVNKGLRSVNKPYLGFLGTADGSEEDDIPINRR
jgi:hypothetical protein